MDTSLIGRVLQGRTETTIPRSAIALVLLIMLFSKPSIAGPVAVLDTLGSATPSTRFSVFGSGGQAIGATQLVGPSFVLATDAVLIEIGGFVNNCAQILMGIPHCPDTVPLVVEIRRSVGGIPDATSLLASFDLSHDDDPLVVSFESVAIHLTLEAGSYFALFGPGRTQDVGELLGFATDPFPYAAGSTSLGFFNSLSGEAFLSSTPLNAAVRILAAPIPEPPTMLLLIIGIFGALGIRICGRRQKAVGHPADSSQDSRIRSFCRRARNSRIGAVGSDCFGGRGAMTGCGRSRPFPN